MNWNLLLLWLVVLIGGVGIPLGAWFGTPVPGFGQDKAGAIVSAAIVGVPMLAMALVATICDIKRIKRPNI